MDIKEETVSMLIKLVEQMGKDINTIARIQAENVKEIEKLKKKINEEWLVGWGEHTSVCSSHGAKHHISNH